MDRLVHNRIATRYPRTVAVADKGLVAVVDKFLSHPLCALLAALLLVVLGVAGVEWTVLVAVGLAWLIAFLWFARSSTVRKLTVLTRFMVLIIAGAVLALVFRSGGQRALYKYREEKKSEEKHPETAKTFKTVPSIKWTEPSPIEYGTALSKKQLNATSWVDGTFVYNPTLGATLPVGTDTLSVIFTPADMEKYFSQTKTVALIVRPLRHQPITRAEISEVTCVQPALDPDLRLIFKADLLHDEKHKCQIQRDLTTFRKYLVALGLVIPARDLAIGVAADDGTRVLWSRTGSPYDGEMLLLGKAYLDNQPWIIQTYASKVLADVGARESAAQDREYWDRARLTFAYYFTYSFLKKELPEGFHANKWLMTFWDIRKPDPDFGDALLALALRSFKDSSRKHKGQDFDTYMNDRLADGLAAVDDVQHSHLVLVERALMRNEVMKHDPNPATIQSLYDEARPAAKAAH
jgi:hypothetical protein